MNRTKIQAVLGLSATLVCALGFAALAHAGGGDNDNPYNMPRSFGNGGGTGGGSGGGGSGGNAGDDTQAMTASIQRGPIVATPGADKSEQTQGKTTLIPYTVEAGAQVKLVTALDATHASVDANGAQIKTLIQSPYVAIGVGMPSLKALAGSTVSAKNLVDQAKLQGVFEIQPGAAKVIARLPANRQAALASVSIGTLGSNGAFAVEQTVTVPVMTAGLDLSALAAQWASMPNTAGKTIKVQLGAGEAISLATVTFPAGTTKPTFRVDTTPTTAP